MPPEEQTEHHRPVAVALSRQELREVVRYAAQCATGVLGIFESDRPADSRPREAIGAAWVFAAGGERTKSLRESAWAANRAAREAGTAAGGDAAHAAGHAAAAAFLHPLSRSHQVKHILGAAAHAARAAELLADDDRAVGAEHLDQARRLATSIVVAVLRRYPQAPRGGGRVAELVRDLDAALRAGG